MTETAPIRPILELRVAVTTGDFERLEKFYRDGLGLEPDAIWNNEGGRGQMYLFDRAALEIFDSAQAEIVDRVETGARLSGSIRFAFEVPDLEAALERLRLSEAAVIHPPVNTPWGDFNARVQDPDGLQITLFQSRKNVGA